MLPPVKIKQTPQGQFLLFDGPDSVNRQLLAHGNYEPLNLMIAQTLVRMNRRPGVIIDGGANLGAFTVPLARAFYSGHRVHAFEVQRVVFCQLCGNIALNRLDNVHPHNVALSDRNEILSVPEPDYAVDANVGALSVDPAVRRTRAAAGKGCATDRTDARMVTAPAITLDSLGLDDVRFVKLDVEGHELAALKGMAGTLARSDWPSIMMEAWEDARVPAFVQTRADMTAYAESLGYEVTPLGEVMLAQHRSRPTLLRLTLEADGVTCSGQEVARSS
jgi:FkbM family methyltransferase